MSEPTPDVKSVFGKALELPSPADRAAYLDAACAGHPALRAEVGALLAALDRAGDFLNAPAPPAAGTATFDHPARDPAATGSLSPDEQPGAVVAGRYKLLQQIGEGGMGTVWMADQFEPVKRRVAVKLIRDERGASKTILSRFEAERQAIAIMDHPHIAKLLDAGTTDAGQPFFVMELVKGVPLTDFCDAHKLSIADRLGLFRQICSAVQHAHQKGVIHRDLKPTNILVESHDGKPVPKVIDFGLAKATSGLQLTDHTLFTAFGSVMGTPLYMAPEQATFNAVDVDTRADVYALGVILYELLTGTTPLTRDTVKQAALDEMLRLVREQEAPTPSSRLSSSDARPSIAANRQMEPAKLSRLMKGELDWIVMRALAKERDRRYESAAALSRDVERHLTGEPVEACPPTLGYRLRKLYRRNRAAVRVGLAFAAVVLVGVVSAAVLAVQAREAEKQANANAARASENAERASENEASAMRAESDAKQERNAAQALADRNRRLLYASEMNLLQAAYERRDFEPVKKLLDAQRPGPGADDPRGFEWHYWNRKLNGHAKEIRIPVWGDTADEQQPDAQYFTRMVAVSPDGTKLASCGLLNFDRTVIKVWDLDSGRKLNQVELPKLEKPSFPFSDALRITWDQQSKVICVIRKESSPDLGGMRNHECWLWDARSTILSKLSTIGRVLKDENEVISSLSADFKFAVVASGRLGVGPTRIVKIENGEEIAQFATPVLRLEAHPKGDALLTYELSPRPRDPAEPKQPGRVALEYEAHLTLRAIGQKEPLWRFKDAATSGTVRLDWSVKFLGTGDRFLRSFESNGLLTVGTFDTATGKELRTITVPNPPTSRATNPAAPPLAVVNGAGDQFLQSTTCGAVVVDLGEPRYNAWEGRAGPPRDHSVTIESLEGETVAAGFRGRDVVTVALDRATPEAVVRTWALAKPELVNNGTFIRTPGSESKRISRDGSHIVIPDRQFSIPPGKGVALPRGPFRVLNNRGTMVFEPAAPARNVGSITDFAFTPDNRFLVGILVPLQGRVPDVEEGRKATVKLQELIAWNLTAKSEIGRITAPTGTTFGEHTFNRVGNRILVNIHTAPKSSGGPPSARLGTGPILAAKVYEFPSLHHLHDLELPPGDAIASTHFHPMNDECRESKSFFMGRVRSSVISGTQVHHWDPETGKRLGKKAVAAIPVEKYSLDGSRFVREFPNRYEIWDARRTGPGDRPISTIENSAFLAASISPDGKRLVLSDNISTNKRTLKFFDSQTGREVLTIHSADNNGFSDEGIWSADSTQFWNFVDGDGKLTGFDARPLPEPAK